MSGPRNSLIKRFVYILLILVFILGAFYFLVDDQEAKAPEPVKDDASNTEEFVKEIVSLSKKGKVIESPFISGQSDRDEVTSQWGEAKETTKTDSGDYMKFPDHHITVGYLDDAIFDIRSFDSKIQGIRLNDIKKYSGEPDETKYYKDESHNQAILIYHVNASYQLKWILPKSTDENPNPAVDHVSVVSLAKNEASENRMTELLSKMSLDEKIGQMMLAGINGTEVNENTKRLIHQYHVGGIIFFSNNLTDPKQTVQLLNQIKSENDANPLPLLLSVDQEGGRVTRLPGDLVNFPTNQEIGTINSPDFSYKVGTLLGKELNEFGFNLDFAPVLDINSNPNNPVIGDRSFGEDPDIVSHLGISTMKGIQSQHIISTIKHFPGHGDTSVD
ncbi:MAG: glycoside hydrolase family 3 N-terminal domain-containing protein, partial [Anaerobacillus sp.]